MRCQLASTLLISAMTICSTAVFPSLSFAMDDGFGFQVSCRNSLSNLTSNKYKNTEGDYYSRLGASPSMNEEELQLAFKNKKTRLLIDKHQALGDSKTTDSIDETLSRMYEAASVLFDQAEREQYDLAHNIIKRQFFRKLDAEYQARKEVRSLPESYRLRHASGTDSQEVTLVTPFYGVLRSIKGDKDYSRDQVVEFIGERLDELFNGQEAFGTINEDFARLAPQLLALRNTISVRAVQALLVSYMPEPITSLVSEKEKEIKVRLLLLASSSVETKEDLLNLATMIIHETDGEAQDFGLVDFLLNEQGKKYGYLSSSALIQSLYENLDSFVNGNFYSEEKPYYKYICAKYLLKRLRTSNDVDNFITTANTFSKKYVYPFPETPSDYYYSVRYVNPNLLTPEEAGIKLRGYTEDQITRILNKKSQTLTLWQKIQLNFLLKKMTRYDMTHFGSGED